MLRKATYILILIGLVSASELKAIVKYTAVPGVWNVAGNWSPAGVPSGNDTIILNHDMSGSNITVDNAGTLTVTPGVYLTLTGVLNIKGKVINEGLINTDEISLTNAGELWNCDTVITVTRMHAQNNSYVYNSPSGVWINYGIFEPDHSGVRVINDGYLKSFNLMDFNSSYLSGKGNIEACTSIDVSNTTVEGSLDFCACNGFSNPLTGTPAFFDPNITICSPNVLVPDILQSDYDTTFVNVIKNIRVRDNDTIGTFSIKANSIDTTGLLQPSWGTISPDLVTGTINYTPGLNFVGNDTFQYMACDTFCSCDTATVYITVIYQQTEVDCANGFDDDNDGLLDCSDNDCMPAIPGAISVSNYLICKNTLNEAYSIAPVAGAVSYDWSVPPGANITSGQGTTSIIVDWGTTEGLVSVRSFSGICYSNAQTELIKMINKPLDPVILH